MPIRAYTTPSESGQLLFSHVFTVNITGLGNKVCKASVYYEMPDNSVSRTETFEKLELEVLNYISGD